MRNLRRPLAFHLVCLVLATVVPAAWVAAALAMSLYVPDWRSATVLVVGIVALVAGAGVSMLLAKELRRAIADLAIEMSMLGRDRKPARLNLAVEELQALSDALVAAGARVRPPATPVEPPPERPAWRIAPATWGEAIDVAALLTSVVTQTRGHARVAGLDLAADLAPGLSTVDAVAVELEEALLRLVINAITYTPRGRAITLAAAGVPGGVRIAIGEAHAAADAMGMRLAGAYVELNLGAAAARNMRFVRQLVERSGGTLAHAHIPGGGEVATITLPASSAARSAA